MTVFLGDNGRILLKRRGANSAIVSVVNPSDVRESVNRFSVDYAHEQFITGDRLEIKAEEGDISWINHPDVDESFTRFINVDAAGGIRLYDTFAEAIKGDASAAILLKAPPIQQACSFKVVDGSDYRCLAEVSSFSITTERETIDTTNLGSYFRKQYDNGLIQGQGQIECFWVNNTGLCDSSDPCETEFSSYLAKLCIRLVHGADFFGQFFIYSGGESGATKSVWYEGETCIITSVAVTVSPDQVISSTIDFVTSGPITLREGYIRGLLELEQNSDLILQEQLPGGGFSLENPD